MGHDRNLLKTIWTGPVTSNAVTAIGPLDASGTNAVSTGPIGGRGFKVKEIVTKCLVAQTAATATITVERQCTPTSATGDRQMCTFTLTVAKNGTIGDVNYFRVEDFADTDLGPGESLSFTSDGGGDTGSYYIGVIGYEFSDGEVPDSIQEFTEKATPRNGTGKVYYGAATDGTHA